jgi:membrane protein YdbS with pleckstrin-like domain
MREELGEQEEDQETVENCWRRLDPERIPAERLGSLILMLFFLVPVGGGLLAMWFFSDWNQALRGGVSIGVGVLASSLGILLYCWPVLEHRRTTWCLDSEGLEIRRGVLWRHLITVPRRRIQHTDVSQGPVQRRFGLGTLIIHTAGTHSYEIRLEGIAHSMALRVRDALLVRTAEVGEGVIETEQLDVSEEEEWGSGDGS